MALFGRKMRRVTRLLVVEDEPLVAFDAEHVLGDAGYTVVATTDRVAEATRLDGHVRLADGSGVAVATAAQEAGIPVLFVTGECPPEARSLAVACLAKPYASRDLLAAIRAVDEVLEGRSPKRVPGGFLLF